MKGIASILAVGAGLLGRAAADLPPVTVKGNAFFANGQRFYIRGVDYQPGM
jgi:1,3-beta-glucanosyltransferase GAS5